MASDNQVALARIQRGTAGNLSKATRQAVAPFLQKLYEMASDTATDDLIRWSEAGDSFFVLDHERMAHDVLPRWFKHGNFASFVRQLNMYGFHKIPHLQQGVLRSDTDTELWNFEHPNFHRGQPDLLCLISRKRQASERGPEEIQSENRESTNPSISMGATAGSVLDVNSIINGITAIKRHQTTISADLNDLKTSNQHLWQEAIAARERHKKHQDTINRILKFLAGVFGNSAAPHKGNQSDSPPHAVIPRKRQRLMIEHGQQVKGKGIDDDEVDGVSSASVTANFEEVDDDMNMSNRFATVETPLSASSPPSAPSVAATTPVEELVSPQLDRGVPSSITPADILANVVTPSSSALPSLPGLSVDHGSHTSTRNDDLYDPSTMNQLTSTSQNTNQDAVLQSLLNSPSQWQRLFDAMRAQPDYPMQVPSEQSSEVNNPSSSHHDPYPPDYDYDPDVPSISLTPGFAPSSDGSHTMALLSHKGDGATSVGPLFDNAHQQLLKSQSETERISANAHNIQADINSLIEKLGVDLDTARSLHGTDESHFNEDPVLPRGRLGLSDPPLLDAMQEEPPPPDFDFEALLEQLNSHDSSSVANFDVTEHLDPNAYADEPPGNASPGQINAFLDEVNSQSDASSPTTTRASLEEAVPANGSTLKKERKRKSEVVDVPDDMRTTGKTTMKSKRKRGHS